MMRSLTLTLTAILLTACLTSGPDASAQRARGGYGGRGAGNAPPPETLTVDGQEREYYLHRPSKGGSGAVPLVLAFHGGEGNPLRLAVQTGFNDIADRNGFAVVYPETTGHQWNDGRSTTAGFGDDVRFVNQLIDHLVSSEHIDPARIYATGPSNGGMFTLRLACEVSDRIAAFAVVAASFPDTYYQHCAPKRAVPIIFLHGSEDPFIKWQGGTIPHGAQKGVGGSVIPVPDTVAFWQKNDGCQSKPSDENLPDKADDGTTVEVERYQGCRDGSAVTLVRIMGGGHTWPGSRKQNPRGEAMTGRVTQDIDGTQMIWDFFHDHTLQAGKAAGAGTE